MHKDKDKAFLKWVKNEITKPDKKYTREVWDEDINGFKLITNSSYSNADDIKTILEEFLVKFSNYKINILPADNPDATMKGWLGFFVKDGVENAFLLNIHLSDIKNHPKGIEIIKEINQLIVKN